MLLEALVALVEEGAARPTVPAVAARAGVSVRIVYHHFAGVQQLLDDAVALQSERHRGLLFPIPPRGPPELRISALCRQRRMYFEEMTPILRLTLLRSAGGTGAGGPPAADRAALRDQLAHTLGPELASRGVRSDELLDALEHVTGWDAWRGLRDSGAHTAPSAERVMAMTAAGLLA